MRWKLAGGVCALLVFVGLGMADTFPAIITKVEDGKVTFYKFNFKKKEKGESMTLPVAKNVKVSTGKFNKEEKKFEADKAIEGGIKGEPFKNIGEKGMFANITTDSDNKKITELIIGGFGKKGKKKDQ